MSNEQIQHTFIVRIWAETAMGAAPLQWRGMVEHIASRQRLYFTSMNDLNDFINSRLGHTLDEPGETPQVHEGNLNNENKRKVL
jgi:hypothetical protein